jgi:hypothetical protein
MAVEEFTLYDPERIFGALRRMCVHPFEKDRDATMSNHGSAASLPISYVEDCQACPNLDIAIV